MYLALLEWVAGRRLFRPSRAAALVMADPLQPCRVLMALAGGSVPGMNFEAFLKQANDYDAEDDLFSRHTRFWSELNLTHPVAVPGHVKELTEWVQTGAYDRIHNSDCPPPGRGAPALEGVRGCGSALPRALRRGSWTGRPAGCRRSAGASAAGSSASRMRRRTTAAERTRTTTWGMQPHPGARHEPGPGRPVSFPPHRHVDAIPQ